MKPCNCADEFIVAEREFYHYKEKVVGTRLICKNCGKDKFMPDGCDFCNSTGKRTVTIHSENGDMDIDDVVCTFCNGTGNEI